ncbi:MAG: hypothetical protein DWG83_01180 [Chloroflexi bacterium]|nr:hypothetical protein [Chloroflexota bacterium]MDA1240347.1 hypothetical protein [Chloroflexota bacterium]MQC19167.1 hypothetical protein [Chloroflexota bacterium]
MPDHFEPTNEASAALRAIMDHHSRGEIDAALEAAEALLERWPQYAQARGYLGQTLVTRKRRFADGLAELDRAVEDGGHDPYILFTSGWCIEFVANAIAKARGGPHQPVDATPAVLYARARALFLRAHQSDPDEALIGDIEDMLDVVANATGEPWDETEITKSAPRPR